MSANFGVLGTSTGVNMSTHTVYTCPPMKAAKVKLFGIWQSGAGGSDLAVVVNNVEVAVITAFPANQYTFTNGAGGLLRAPNANAPTGVNPAESLQPSAPIFYLSANQTIQYTVSTNALNAANVQVVGVEVDLTA